MAKDKGISMGNRIAPPRFILFVLLFVLAGAAGVAHFGWVYGIMGGFDIAALVFFASCTSLFRQSDAKAMRRHAAANDANRVGLLAITIAVMAVILVAVGAELGKKGGPAAPTIALIVATLVLSWLFSNIVYAFHYAHLYYGKHAGAGGDCAGIDIPDTKEPDYWDFVYFSFTLGMTFQTSDTQITASRFRRVAIFHCFAAFVFNIGVLAFTINVLGGGH